MKSTFTTATATATTPTPTLTLTTQPLLPSCSPFKSVTSMPTRSCFAIIATILFILLIHLTTSSNSSGTIRHLQTILSPSSCTNTTTTTTTTTTNTTITDAQIQEITEDNRNLIYLYPPVNMLLMTMAKAGTSTLLHWIYSTVSGKRMWDIAKCKAYVHNIRSECWRNYAINVDQLPISEQRRLLLKDQHQGHVLKVAIQRHPYERLISSFKSKFTCDDQIFGTDVHDRNLILPSLINQSGIIEFQNLTCLNISQFATILNAVHARFPLDFTRLLDAHIAPQRFYFDVIPYHMVIDVSHLSDANVMAPVRHRLLLSQDANESNTKLSPVKRHASKGGAKTELQIPERTAVALYSFAMHSMQGIPKFLEGYEPLTSEES